MLNVFCVQEGGDKVTQVCYYSPFAEALPTCCSKQILKALLQKITVIWPLDFHLTDYTNVLDTCLRSKVNS